MFTRKMGRALLVAGAALGVGFVSHQAMAAAGTGHANAVILQAITVTENTQMDFADIEAPTAGGTVTLSDAASPTISGTGFTFAGSPVSGKFTATGAANQDVNITFSTGDTLTDSSSDTMSLGNYTNSAGTTPAFDGTGNLTFYVGADLTVGASQAAGTYSGTYTVTVDY